MFTISLLLWWKDTSGRVTFNKEHISKATNIFNNRTLNGNHNCGKCNNDFI